jgi:hypothetical protein
MSGNLASFQDRIPAKELPPTFLDAIHVTRALGFTHIWIDSLCIIQDDKLDWEQQSSIMASIYSNADLVLAGAAAESANEGFLRKERPSFEGTLSLDIGGSATSFVYRVVPQDHEKIEEPLYKRGWTLQEKLCARRFLAYGNWEMSWECKESSWCEHHGNNCNNDQTSQRHSSFGALMETTTPQEFTGLWRDYVVYPYNQRLLTKATDVPVAISALAARFQSRFQGTYIAGLWGEDLCRDILWRTYFPGRQSAFFAPSWSWMSLELPRRIHYPNIHSEREALVYKAQTEVMPSTTNLYGPVSSGTIRLTGTLIPASFEADPHPGQPVKISTLWYDISGLEFWIDTSLVQMNVRFKNGTEERTTRRAKRKEKGSNGPYPVTLLPIIMDKRCVYGLILGHSATCVGAYERIGTFQYLPGDVFECMRKYHDACDITLV